MKPQGLPYRPPATANDSKAWDAVNRFMRCGNHFRLADAAVPFYTNNTRVHHDQTDAHDHLGAESAPFTRKFGSPGGGSPVDYYAWQLPSNLCATADPITGASGATQLSTTDYPDGYNFYKDSATKVNFSKCRDRGYKVLRSSRSWYGRFGFDYCPDTDAMPSKKYRTVRVKYKVTSFQIDTIGDPPAGHPERGGCMTFTPEVWRLWDFQATINEQSGLIGLDFSNQTASTGNEAGAASAWPGDSAVMSGLANTVCVGADYLSQSGAFCDPVEYSSVESRETSGGGTYVKRYYKLLGEGGPDCTIIESEVWLSNENTLASVQADAEAIAQTWNLASRAVYPFRKDGYCDFPPLVGRDETGSAAWTVAIVSPTQYNQTPLAGGETEADHQSPWKMNGYCWVAAAGGVAAHSAVAKIPAGNIVGRPLVGGYDRFFDWNQITFDHTYHDSGCPGDIVGYGMTSPGVLPPTTTRWLPNFENWDSGCNGFVRPQAFTRASIDGVTIQIYAEVKEWDMKSQNYFRPAGEDRAKTDKNGVALWPKAWGILGREKILSVEDIGSGQIKFTMDAPGSSENGLWPTRVLRNGDKVRLFDNDMAKDDGQTPDHEVPPLVAHYKLGDLTIDSTPTPDVFICTGTFATYSSAAWVMGGIPAATRSLNDLPQWGTADDSPKGQFVISTELISNAGSAGVVKTQHCIKYAPCCASVISIGYKNQDEEGGDGSKKFGNGFNFPIPAVVTPTSPSDVRIWRCVVTQRMQDLLYIETVALSGTSPDCVTTYGGSAEWCDKDIDAKRPGNHPYQFRVTATDVLIRNQSRKIWVEAEIALPTWTAYGVTITAPALPSGDALGAGNTITPEFPPLNLPSNCINGDAMYAYYVSAPGTDTQIYVDKPWTDTSINYTIWNS